MVEDKKTGFLFDGGDVTSLQNALTKMLSAYKKEKWIKMSLASREAAQGMSIDKHVEKLIKAYKAEEDK